MKEPKYSIEVYEDHALISGWMTLDVLKLLIRLCKKEGYTTLAFRDDGKPGFKLFDELKEIKMALGRLDDPLFLKSTEFPNG